MFKSSFVCLLTRDNEEKQTKTNKHLRGTMRTFLFLSLLSALCPAAQSPIVNRGVWLQISWKKEHWRDCWSTALEKGGIKKREGSRDGGSPVRSNLE